MHELEHHAPFTVIGAATGIIVMVFFRNLSEPVMYRIFYTLHPIHVVLSAIVTSSIYRMHTCGSGPHDWKKCNLWLLFVVGYTGTIGIATLSDSVIPYLGETLLNMPHRHAHIGFIEEWWLVNPLAVLGIMIAYFRPHTKFPHAGHVLVSTWASLFHIMMAMGKSASLFMYLAVFVFLFVSVWIPCCISDIAYPLLFGGNGKKQ